MVPLGTTEQQNNRADTLVPNEEGLEQKQHEHGTNDQDNYFVLDIVVLAKVKAKIDWS